LGVPALATLKTYLAYRQAKQFWPPEPFRWSSQFV